MRTERLTMRNATAPTRTAENSELKRQAIARRANGGKPVALYRNPADGASWSGRGLKPRWLVEAIEDGRTQDEFLIENQGAQA
jgi:DNA-binding protein H-NS